MKQADTSKNCSQCLLLWVALIGATAVIAGALGAHALQDRLAASGHASAWATAAQYHLIHAVALLAVTLAPGQRRRLTAWCWIIGILLFSGSIYALSLGGPKWLGPITPVGGVALIIGWLTLIRLSCCKKTD